MPWEPWISSSLASTAPIGSGGVACSPSSSPTWTCRPRGRSERPTRRPCRWTRRRRATRGRRRRWPRRSRRAASGPPSTTHLGAELRRQPECRLGHVDGDDPGAEGGRDHHRRQPHAAAAVDRDPVPGPHLPVGGQGAVGGGEAAAERRGRDEVQVVGQRDDVEVGRRYGDQLGERPRHGEPRLRLVRAHLGVAGRAVVAPPAAADERHGHPLAHPARRHLRADRVDDAGVLVSGHVRQRHRVVSLPGMPVGAADAGGPHRDQHAVGRAVRARESRREPGSRRTRRTGLLAWGRS